MFVTLQSKPNNVGAPYTKNLRYLAYMWQLYIAGGRSPKYKKEKKKKRNGPSVLQAQPPP